MTSRGGLPPTLVLAAGRGTRLGELGRQRAKVLVEIGGRPLLDHQLDHLAREGVSRVFVNAHHLADQIVEHVRGYDGPLDVTVVVEDMLLGTAGAAVNVLERIAGRTMLVVYGDVLIFEPLAPLLAEHNRTGAAGTICVYEHSETHGKGVVEVDQRGRVRQFAEKDPERTAPALVNAGLYVIDSSLLSGLPRNTFLDFGHDVFPQAVRRGHNLQVHRTHPFSGARHRDSAGPGASDGLLTPSRDHGVVTSGVAPNPLQALPLASVKLWAARLT